MKQINTIVKKDIKQRLTAFVDPILVKRAKVRGALEGLTISEVVEKALESYAPKIEKDKDQHIHLKFNKNQTIDTLTSEISSTSRRIAPKHSRHPVVPR